MPENRIAERAAVVVQKAEDGLKDLIGEAAADGDYGLVRRLSGAAESLAEVRGRVARSDAAAESRGAATSVPARRASTRRRKRRQAKPGYPKYARRGDTLLRIGWSRKSQSEYEHKVPKDTFDQIVEALAHLAEDTKGPIAAQDVIEECGLPSYQVYVVLGLLAEALVIERHGREGYTASGPDIPGGALGAWLKVGE